MPTKSTAVTTTNNAKGHTETVVPEDVKLYSPVGKKAYAFRCRLFNGQSVRMQTDSDGTIWFVGIDVCNILGYKNAPRTLADHCGIPEADQTSNPNLKKITVKTEGGKQQLLAIDEANLYRLILRSNKPEAKEFERWVVEEVLPELRKTGSYKVIRKINYTPSKETAEALASGQLTLFPRMINFALPEPITKDMNHALKELQDLGKTFPTHKDYLAYVVEKGLGAITAELAVDTERKFNGDVDDQTAEDSDSKPKYEL